MNWILKAAIQKTLSLLPCSFQINYLIQRHITVGKILPLHFVEDRLRHAQKHTTAWKQFGCLRLEETAVMETGTGWYPIVPVAMFLLGFQSIATIDIRKLCNAASVQQTLLAIFGLHQQNRLAYFLPEYNPERINILKKALKEKNSEDMLRLLSIQQIVSEVIDIPITSGGRDLLISNNTLQFIPTESLPGYFAEIQRIARKGAVFSMAVDFTDEYSHADPAIGPFHFLRYSDRFWELISSPLYAPNRLRYSDFRRFFSQGMEILSEEVRHSKPETLDKIKIDSRFSGYDRTDLMISHAHFSGRIHGGLFEESRK